MTYGVTLVKNGVQLCFHFKKLLAQGLLLVHRLNQSDT